MNKFFSILAVATIGLKYLATAPIQISENGMPDTKETMVQPTDSSRIIQTAPENILTPEHPATKVSDNEEWTEWERFGTFTFPELFLTEFYERISWSGGTCEEWNPQCTVMRRYSKTDNYKSQFRFDDVFNHVDIVMDYDANTSKLTCSKYQSTGIPITADFGPETYEFYHIFFSNGYYFEKSRLFSPGSAFLILYGNMGYGDWGKIYKCMDGYSPLEIEVTNAQNNHMLYPSYVNTAEVKIRKDDGVDSYRVIKYELENHNVNINLSDYFSPVPESIPVPYTDYKIDSFTFDITDNVQTNLIIIPMDENKHPTSNSVYYKISHNKIPEGTWRSLGTGLFRNNNIVYTGISNEKVFEYFQNGYDFENFEQYVDVECQIENPSIFRIKKCFRPFTSFVQ